MRTETWLPVKGFEGLYEVSDMGRVRSLDKMCPIGKRQMLKKGRVLKPTIARGYCRVFLCNGNKETRCDMSIHRLTATAFIPNAANLPSINHIDGNKQNNNIENLEWCDQSHNMQHAFKIGLIKRGNKNAA